MPDHQVIAVVRQTGGRIVEIVIEFQNNLLRQYNTELSPIVFYLNCHVPVNLSNSSISGERHVFKRDVKRIRGREDVKYLREPNLALRLFTQGFCRDTFQVTLSASNKTFVNIGFKID